MADHDSDQLGPLAGLAGVWEGDRGIDLALDAARTGVAKSPFRERQVITPIGQVDNREQTLFGLHYSAVAWRIGAADPFHQETGYWLYEPATQLVMRCFLVPRGISVLAGGHAAPGARSFELSAEVGSPTFGISSNPFLDREFRTVRFTIQVTLEPDGSWSYDEHSLIEARCREAIFDHHDANTLHRTSRS